MKKVFLTLSASLLLLNACSSEPVVENESPEESNHEELVETFELNGSLVDVTGGTATGTVGASFVDGSYILKAEFQDLPALEEGYFYEGWVVKNQPLSVISTGATTNTEGLEINLFESEEDLSDHLFYVLTLEPDDGDPAPAAHILEGTME